MGREVYNPADDYRGVTANEIRWTHDENIDLLVMDPDQLYAYTRDLQTEVEGLRALLHDTMKALGAANIQRDRLSGRLRELTSELRLARHEIRALQAHIGALQGYAA